ncbi:MAG: transposase [Spirochaetes bacterium]|nr:transposase [Spirochaetota bacterium]
MKLRETTSCLNCEHLTQRVATLEDKLLQAMERIAKVEEENARLQQQLAAARKDSSTSSKPPSSDIVKPKKPLPKGGQKRKKGGQPGHEQHLRSPFPPEAVNHFEPHTLDCCPDCGGTLVLSRHEPEVLQQVEITDTPTVVTEHQGVAYWCPHCRKVHYAPMPEMVVKAGLFGPRLTALVAFMKGVCHASFSTIRKFLRDVLVQFCMAHLIRDVKFLLTLPGREVQAYGPRLRDALRDLFGVIHRREKMTATGFQKALEAAREQVMKAATTRVPDAKHARNLAKRFRENGEAYFRFITTPGIGPTNNLAEQAIHFVVIDRHITQGTRSEKGRRWCERIWTVIATCAQQGRAVFQFLLDSVQAHLCGTPPPSLLPSGS